jgi:hypothetical protein
MAASAVGEDLDIARLPAAKLGADQAQVVAEHPQEWRVGIGVDLDGSAIDAERDRHREPS